MVSKKMIFGILFLGINAMNGADGAAGGGEASTSSDRLDAFIGQTFQMLFVCQLVEFFGKPLPLSRADGPEGGQREAALLAYHESMQPFFNVKEVRNLRSGLPLKKYVEYIQPLEAVLLHMFKSGFDAGVQDQAVIVADAMSRSDDLRRISEDALRACRDRLMIQELLVRRLNEKIVGEVEVVGRVYRRK